MKKIVLFSIYFGKLPAWFQAYLDSCSYNYNYDFFIFTDDQSEFIVPSNVKINRVDFINYKKIISKSLNVDFINATPYKLCDVRPFIYFIHKEIIQEYDYWGYADIDLVYGDLNKFFKEHIDHGVNLISTNRDRVSGHFCLFNVTFFENISPMKIYGWKQLLQDERHLGVDEKHFSKCCFRLRGYNYLYHPLIKKVFEFGNLPSFLYGDNFFVKELYTTPFTNIGWHEKRDINNHPKDWCFDNGSLYALDDGFEVPYLHFMNFKKSKWNITSPIWTGNELFYSGFSSKKFRISGDGIKAE